MSELEFRADASCSAEESVVRVSARGHSSAGQSIGLRSRSSAVGRSLAERFWSFVDKSGGPDYCWPWLGGADDEGYGRFYVDAARPCVRANRFSLELDGRQAFPWEDVAHGCDFPPCVNPAHLEPMAHRENLRQMAARGRMRGGRIWQRLPGATASAVSP